MIEHPCSTKNLHACKAHFVYPARGFWSRFGGALPPDLSSKIRVVVNEADTNAMLRGRCSSSHAGWTSADNKNVELFHHRHVFSADPTLALRQECPSHTSSADFLEGVSKTHNSDLLTLRSDAHPRSAKNLAAALMRPAINFYTALKANSHGAKYGAWLSADRMPATRSGSRNGDGYSGSMRHLYRFVIDSQRDWLKHSRAPGLQCAMA